MATQWDPGMDELTHKLILKLQSEDAEEVVASSKGKDREGEKSDAKIALDLYKQTLETHATLISDQFMTRNIARETMANNKNFVLDERTHKLVIQMQMKDMESIVNSFKGKGREGEKSDAEIAMNLYKQNLEKNATLMSDRVMNRSIANAVSIDGLILAREFEEEDKKARNSKMNSGKGKGKEKATDDVAVESNGVRADESQVLDDEVLNKLAAQYRSYSITDSHVESMETGESSAWAASRPKSVVENRPCVSCGDNFRFFDLARVPCNHEYCRGCIHELFRLAVHNESLFPPRCCRQHITLVSVRLWLDQDLVRKFLKKKVEMETPDRTYCCNKACSEFIAAENIIAGIATCEKCKTETCTKCKSVKHTATDCPNDTALQQVLELAEANKWKRCYSCSSVVDIYVGCNHVTCRCGAEFCYVCAKRWKTCNCAPLLGRALGPYRPGYGRNVRRVQFEPGLNARDLELALARDIELARIQAGLPGPFARVPRPALVAPDADPLLPVANAPAPAPNAAPAPRAPAPAATGNTNNI